MSRPVFFKGNNRVFLKAEWITFAFSYRCYVHVRSKRINLLIVKIVVLVVVNEAQVGVVSNQFRAHFHARQMSVWKSSYDCYVASIHCLFKIYINLKIFYCLNGSSKYIYASQTRIVAVRIDAVALFTGWNSDACRSCSGS